MTDHHHSKVLIIGSGPAGYTAAIYAARANLMPMMVMGMQPGGQLTVTTDVENYPGFADVIQGPWLMEQMHAQAVHVGTRCHQDMVLTFDAGARPFRAVGDSGTVYTGETAVIATGAQARWLGLESERAFNGRGVSACATCDGFFYRGKDVAVIGGGNTAVEEALYLAGIAAKVTLVHRRDALRAEKLLQDRLFRHDRIEVIWNHVVEEVLGGDGMTAGVEALRLRSVGDGAVRALPVAGMFVAIGHDPATDIFRGQVDMDEAGYILSASDSTATSVAGLFAAGDVTDRIYRQAVTAAGMGCMAALEAERFLAESAA